MNHKSAINGLVLMGGKSLRMGQDKAHLIYHQKAQYLHCYDLLKNYCNQVYLSCSIFQKVDIPILIDSDKYPQSGPMTALYTAFEFSKKPWVVLAVDYPLIDDQDLAKLINERDSSAKASVFFNHETGFFESFIGIYEVSFGEIIRESLDLGKSSMQQLLAMNPVKKVLPLDVSHIQSIDFPEQMEQLKKYKP